MIGKTLIRYAVATALGSLLLASAALAGPQVTFGPENQGTLKLEYKGQFQVLARDIGSGYNNVENTYNFNFRRNRLALMGAYGDVMSMYVQTEFTEDPTVNTLGVSAAEPGSTFQLLDAVMRFNFADEFKLSVGKFKYNMTRENLEACENPLTLDRSLFLRSPYVTTRDMGLAVWGNLLQDKLQYRADVMEGRKAVSYAAAPKSDFRFSARGHVSLFEPENEYGYKGTYLGTKKVLTLGAAVQYEPNLVFDDMVAPTKAKSYTGWTTDYFLEYPMARIGTSTLSGAYEDVSFDDAYLAASPDLGSIGINGQKSGWYVKAGHMLPQLPLQFFGRYETWRFALLDNVYDQGVEWLAGGANYYVWGQNLKVSGEVGNTRFDKKGTFSGVQGTSLRTKDFNTFTAQLQVIF
jgi:hypothetical protein